MGLIRAWKRRLGKDVFVYVEKMAGSLVSSSKTPARAGRMRAVAAFSSCAFALLVATSANADPRTEYFIKQLKSDDFKVRTQAALALGASGDAAAVSPLCGALSDSNGSVKVASAAALGKLGKTEGVSCLKTARSSEKDQSVVAQIDQSLQKLGGGGDAPAVIGPNTKFYVAIQVTNKTSRSDGEIDGVVRSAATAKLLAAAGYAVAPRSETPAKGGDVIKSKKLKGLLLITSIDTPVYKGGQISISVNSTIWTYPDKSLKATINAKRTTDAASNSDVDGENLLIQAASEDAAVKLIAAAAKL